MRVTGYRRLRPLHWLTTQTALVTTAQHWCMNVSLRDRLNLVIAMSLHAYLQSAEVRIPSRTLKRCSTVTRRSSGDKVRDVIEIQEIFERPTLWPDRNVNMLRLRTMCRTAMDVRTTFLVSWMPYSCAAIELPFSLRMWVETRTSDRRGRFYLDWVQKLSCTCCKGL